MHEHDADDDYSSTGDPEERSIGPAVFHDTVAVLKFHSAHHARPFVD